MTTPSSKLDAATIRELLGRIDKIKRSVVVNLDYENEQLIAIARYALELSDKVERLQLRIEEQICSCCASDIEKLNTQEGSGNSGSNRDYYSTN